MAGNNTARNWQRGATRRAILDAARLVAARTGATDFSLNTVAKEAGYSTTTVFAYFPTKNDLFVAIVADDLASLARDMRASYGLSPEPEVPVQEPELEAEAAEIAADTERTMEAAPEPVTQESTVVAFAPPSDTKPELEPAKTAEPARADAWLERRLRVFEKSLADIEMRLTSVQKESASSANVVVENTKIFSARLDTSEKRMADLSGDLSTRMAATEKRVRDAQCELRSSLLSACTRIDELESAARRVAAQAGYEFPVSPATPDSIVPAEPDALTQAEPEAVVEKPLTAAADTYLSAARRAAKTAAALAEMEKQTVDASIHPWLNRKNALFAAAGLVVFIVGALAAYAVGEQVGRSTPIRIVVPRGVPHLNVAHRAKTAEVTPLDRLSAMASSGNARAEVLIGLRYLKGETVDKAEAAKWITKSALAHDPLGQYWLGQLYDHGDGVPIDAAVALHWYEAAAGQGNRQAMHNLGVAYAEGKGTDKDVAEGARWFAKAAALGLTNSQFNLAVLYERGEGVKQSLVDAYKWYAIAAASGDKESKTRIEAIGPQLNGNDLAAAQAAISSFKPTPPEPDANAEALPGA